MLPLFYVSYYTSINFLVLETPQHQEEPHFTDQETEALSQICLTAKPILFLMHIASMCSPRLTLYQRQGGIILSFKPAPHTGPRCSPHTQTTGCSSHGFQTQDICKTKPPFPQQKVNTTQLPSQTADAYRHCIMPNRVWSAQRQPQRTLDSPRAWH